MKILVQLIFLATLAVIFQGTFADDDEKAAAVKEFLEKSAQCKEKLGITSEEAEEAERAHKSGSDIDDKFKCFAHCIAEEMDILDSNNKFDVQKIENKHNMGQDELQRINECKAVHDIEENDCEYSFKMMGCMMTK